MAIYMLVLWIKIFDVKIFPIRYLSMYLYAHSKSGCIQMCPCLSVDPKIKNFVTKVEKWWHLSPVDTFLVFIIN